MFTTAVHAYLRPNFKHTFPCTFSKEDNAKIRSLPPNNQILGYDEMWSTEQDIAILDTDISAPVVPTELSPNTINQVYLVGYPSYISQRAYEDKYKSAPPRSYEEITRMFGGFSNKVLSRSSENSLCIDKKLLIHHCPSLGGMSGGGVFVEGALIGIHLSGFAAAGANVFYPIAHPLFSSVLKNLFK